MQRDRRIFTALIVTGWSQLAIAQGGDLIYTLNPRANFAGTAHALDFDVKPSSLKRKFGMPLLNDGDSESMGTYIFVGSAGEVLTVYYRANDVPRARIEALRERFWNEEDSYTFSIGAKSKAHARPFEEWLRSAIGAK